MKRKKNVFLIGIFIFLFIIVCTIGVYLIYDYQKTVAIAKNIPFELSWGMSRDDVKDHLFNEYGLVHDAEINDLVLYKEINWNKCLISVTFTFPKDRLQKMSFIIKSNNFFAKRLAGKLFRVYQKTDDSMEIIDSDDKYSRMYFLKDRYVDVHCYNETVSYSISSIEFWDAPSGNLIEDAREEMEALGLKKIVLPETQQGAPLLENHKNN